MKIVTINSSQDLFVYASSITTNPSTEQKAFNPNPLWTKTKVLIKKGIHNYPAEIVEWATVQALAKAFIISIGATHEGEVEDDTIQTAIANKKQAEKIEKEEKVLADKKKARKQKLEELADLSVEKQLQESLVD